MAITIVEDEKLSEEWCTFIFSIQNCSKRQSNEDSLL